MEKYKIIFKKSVRKDFQKIEKKDVKKILEKINLLSENPRGKDSKKLTGDDKYRIRQGNYRILYKIEDFIVTVTIVKIAHRKFVYKKN